MNSDSTKGIERALESDVDTSLRKVIEAAWEKHDKRDNVDYDGILGIPDDWIGPDAMDRFRNWRNLVLDKWGFLPDEAIEWLDKSLTIGTDNDEWFCPSNYPNGGALDTDFFYEVMGWLAHLRGAVSLEKEKGIGVLQGSTAVRGYKMEQGPKKKREDALKKVLLHIVEELRQTLNMEPEFSQVLEQLELYSQEEGHVIQEVCRDGKKVWWKGGPDKGTSFKSIQNRLTGIKKESHKQ